MKLKTWNNFERNVLLLSFMLIVVLGLILKCELLTISVAFLGIFCSINKAKGKVIGLLSSVVLAILYSTISYKNKYFGEFLIYTFVMLPIYSFGVFTWLKYRDKRRKRVIQNNIAKKEFVILLIINIILFRGFYLLLKAFNTSQLIISTISMIVKLDASYLLFRRNKYNFVFYLIGAIILLILWGIPVFNGNYKLLPMIFNAIFLIINNIYGLYRWSRNK